MSVQLHCTDGKKCTVARETDIQSLQFKITNRCIPFKENLYLWGKESSDKCRLCNEIDTIEHFFAQCSYDRVFWQGVSKLIQRALDDNIKLYDLDIIFRLSGEEDIFRIINFCILYGKKYIFGCRINENIVLIDRFNSKLKNRLEVEIYIIDSCCIRLNTKKSCRWNCTTACALNPLLNLNMVTKFDDRKKCLSIVSLVLNLL